MSGLDFSIDVNGLNAAVRDLAGFDAVMDELPDGIAGMIEGQTRNRLKREKTGPDGTPWPEWSPRYAKSKRRGQSLLVASGDMLDSITGYAIGPRAIVGSDKVYAAIQQFGGRDDMAAGPAAIPARPFLGLSPDNEDQITREIVATLEASLS